jgi:tRNA-splicing ligase RtcB (3'-phosphate/5'-hydroxy nucleic acid ligase)
VAIEPVDYTEPFVYDLTVQHPDHNFVANGFVVSNCGVRLLRTDLTEKQVRPRLKELVDQIFRDVPAGFGGEGLIKTSRADLRQVMLKGAHWMIEHGYGWADDLAHTEATGRLDMPDPDVITEKAIERGKDQLGTLGGGNHFLEIQVVDEIYDPVAAQAMGITQVGQVTIMIHTGSRGFGHQTCQDHLDIMEEAHRKYDISLPDRQLACAPIQSEEGQTYLRAMHCAANFAFANRQAIAHWDAPSVRQNLQRHARKPRHVPSVRCGAQHRQNRRPRVGRQKGARVRASQGGDPRLPTRTSRNARSVPRSGAALC